jgi:hypothetical protein
MRTLLLRRTVAIWHRPTGSTRGRSLKQYAKYHGARLIKFVPLVALISVQNPQLQPEIAELCTDWIYQIADWYRPLVVSDDDQDKCRLLMEVVHQHANGRAIIMFLGTIAPEKGFEFFTDLLVEDLCNRAEFAFVAAGKVSLKSTDAVHRFMKGGGLLLDRYLSDGEFLVGIEVADWVWNCYRPDNDQNSGIFGLAYLAGARVIVRSDSYVARAALDLQFPTVQIQYADAKGALAAIRASRTLLVEKPRQEMIRAMKERAGERLLYYLGCATGEA